MPSTRTSKSKPAKNALENILREVVRVAAADFKKTGDSSLPGLKKALTQLKPRHKKIMRAAKEVRPRAERLAARKAAQTPDAIRVWADELTGNA